MPHIIIDRRKNAKNKSSVNRQKFIKRVKGQVRDAVKEVIRDGKIEDIVGDSGKKINVPIKDLNEPNFQYGEGGMTDKVLPGNHHYNEGDRIDRPEEGEGGGGSKGSKDGEGEDEFSFHLTKEEFLDLFFEDLELPDLLKKDLATVDEYAYSRAGFSTDGNPARLNVLRSMKQAKARKFALRSPKKKKLRVLEEELKQLDITIEDYQSKGQDCSIEQDRKKVVVEEIKVIKRKIRAIPFIDDVDLRYNRWEKHPIPVTQAVMFCIMDVSGSMGEWEKEMSKRFFMLLYLFLTKNYKRVELVFIRHHSIAKEVDEDEFFHSRESGGTVVSPALELMYNIVQQRYPRNSWNIYACQASDGDNWLNDCPVTQDVLTKKILGMVQHYAYVEIDRRGSDSDLWPYYEDVKLSHDNFDMSLITDATDIYPVFRKLFEKKK
jgi:uncharacterized sporulation protein YeaH/YhbH (DUF444 family)